jgi:hypothetical protein
MADGAAAGTWPEGVDRILDGDLVVAIGLPTARGGVALSTVSPLGMRDRTAGIVSFSTSLGFGRKLERIAADPRIAVLYHTRQHGQAQDPGLVLVQGHAAVRHEVSDDDLAALYAVVEQRLGALPSGPFWNRWLEVYRADRVLIDVTANRILWWPTDDHTAPPQVFGAPLPIEPPADQPPPKDAEVPRLPVRRIMRTLRRQPHRILGVLLADGTPILLPVADAHPTGTGFEVEVASPLLPPGRRRAGLLTHAFRQRVVGLSTATHTGWLVHEDTGVRWTPHTRHAFAAPPNKTLLLLLNGLAARLGYRSAIKQGRDRILQHGQSTIATPGPTDGPQLSAPRHVQPPGEKRTLTAPNSRP